MFRMKKSIFLLLTVLFIITLFAGCKIEVPAKVSGQAQSELSSTTESTALLSQPEPESKIQSAESTDKTASAASKTVSSKAAKPATNSNSPKASSSSPTQSVQQNSAPIQSNKLTCTLMISCKTLLNHINELDQATKSIIPSDGILYKKRTVEFKDGETVFDVLLRETKANSLKLDYQSTTVYNSVYVTDIGGIGHISSINASGWKYSVNGTFLNVGCSLAKLKNGDNIEWHYTCDYLGRDIT